MKDFYESNDNPTGANSDGGPEGCLIIVIIIFVTLFFFNR
jgi:hypothetical protein